MAELSAAETTADSCCAPEQQAACCEPSEKRDCCAPESGSCGCSAGQSGDDVDVREQRMQLKDVRHREIDRLDLAGPTLSHAALPLGSVGIVISKDL
jgi:hypothetical protein